MPLSRRVELMGGGGRTPAEPSEQMRETQKRAYAKVQPILVDMEVNDAYQLALQAIAGLAAAAEAGRQP